jgi:uncharacterized protein (TIGR02147 family)
MPDLFSYLDYREYLRDRFRNEKEKSPFYSYRYIGSRVGLDSGQLTKILQGQLHISSKKNQDFIDFLKLEGKEAEYFETLVLFNKAKNKQQINIYFDKLLSFREVRPQELEVNQFAFYVNWYNAAIFAHLDLKPFKGDFSKLAKELRPTITAEKAEVSVKLLESLGLVKRAKDGFYKITQAHVVTPEKWRSAAVLAYQKAAIELASNALESVPKNQREVNTLTMSINKEALEQIRRLTEEYRNSMLQIVNDCKKATMVYQFNTQLFPLSAWEDEND